MNSRVWDILSILGLVSICCLVVVFAAIAMDPNSPLNPFPPPTMPALIELPTSTPTLRSLPPTWTATSPVNRVIEPTQTLPPTRTGWVLPTFTPTPTNTATRTNTPTVTKTPTDTRVPTNTLPPTITPNYAATYACETIVAGGGTCP